MASRARQRRDRFKAWLRRTNLGPVLVAVAFVCAATVLFVLSLLISRVLSDLPGMSSVSSESQGRGGGVFAPTPTATTTFTAAPTGDARLDELLTRVAGMALTTVAGTATPGALPTATPTATGTPAPTATATFTPAPTASPTPTEAVGLQAAATASPSPTPTRTPTPTPTAVPVFQLQGDSVRQTAVFEIASSSWFVEWSTGATQSNYNMKVLLGDPARPEMERELMALVDELVGANGVHSGAVVVPPQFGPGKYYFRIFGPPSWDGGWRIVVRENQ